MRIILPLLGWRVPVALLRGPARGSGREVVLLHAGPASVFIKERFFAQEPVVERCVRVPVWRLQRLLDEWRSTADLVAVGIDRVSARLFLRPHDFEVPMWLSSLSQVPEDLQVFTRNHKSAQADIRRVRIKNFECHLSRAAEDLDCFYDRFYVPFIPARHGEKVALVPRWRMRLMFRMGMLYWITQAGERLSGCLVIVKGGQFRLVVNGMLDGRLELLQHGALSAIYVHSILEARKLGCKEIDMGGSKPWLQDGVFRYKNKWASELRLLDGAVSSNRSVLLSWNRMAGPVAEFFTHTSLIHHDGDGFSALTAFPQEHPLTAETLQQHHNQIKAKGLRCLTILLPGEVPADFVCPSGVRLISGGTVSDGGPERLKLCGQPDTPAGPMQDPTQPRQS